MYIKFLEESSCEAISEEICNYLLRWGSTRWLLLQTSPCW